jgi:hypothetical protein
MNRVPGGQSFAVEGPPCAITGVAANGTTIVATAIKPSHCLVISLPFGELQTVPVNGVYR